MSKRKANKSHRHHQMFVEFFIMTIRIKFLFYLQIKRLQVNKWFNSPTDNLFSPCSKKLFNKKIVHPVHLLDEMKNCDQPNFDVENIESFDNDNDENISQ